MATDSSVFIRSNIVWNQRKSLNETKNGSVNADILGRTIRMEFVYNKRARDCKCWLIFMLPAWSTASHKMYLYKLAIML